MFETSQYQLLDFGAGRKLERFGRYVLDRPAPAANEAKAAPELWGQADGFFRRDKGPVGRWKWSTQPPADWQVVHEKSVFALQATEHGHLGLFVEQAANWDWIASRLEGLRRPARVLNLFAYTGGSTLAVAAAAAEVVHVDAAKNIVAKARRNARLSGLHAAPIRWIVEDARKFIAREKKRENRYDAVILDPPSYGHGPKGEPWKIDRHLPDLVHDCGRLTETRGGFILLTCHSPGWDSRGLEDLLRSALPRPGNVAGRRLELRSADGRKLVVGQTAYWVP